MFKKRKLLTIENRAADVVVIGGGIVGCAAAYYLARRGVSVILCEKGDVGLEQSSRNWGFVRQQLRDIVPASKSRILWAMYTPSDGQAEPRKLCPAFKRAAQAKGAQFLTQCAVESIELQNGRVAGVQTEQGSIQASMVVCAAGAWSTRLLRPLGVKLPSIEVTALRFSRFKEGVGTKHSPVV